MKQSIGGGIIAAVSWQASHH